MKKKSSRFEQNPGNSAICYYRYSSDAQRDCSIEQQREAAYEYAKQHNLNIIKEYDDKAISGTRSDRENYQLMLSQINSLRPAYLILWKTDRLSRDKYEATIAKSIIRKAGCKIVYVAEQIPEDEGMALIMESILEAFSEQYIINLRQNVTRGLYYNAERCLYNGVKILGFKGETDKAYTIDENTAPVVKRIFSEYANGKALKAITDDLNRDGLRSIKGKEFTINSIRAILRNRAYIGEYHYGDVCIDDGMPRIISDELFYQAQERFEKNKRKSRSRITQEEIEKDSSIEFWLTNNCKCGLCGGEIHGMTGTGRHGDVHAYYICKNHKKKQCEKKNVRKEALEMVVDYALDTLIHDGTARVLIAKYCYDYYISNSEDSGALIKSFEASIKDVDVKLNNIMKAIEAGIFNDMTAQRMEELQKQKQAMLDELSAVKLRSKYALKLEDVVRFLDTAIESLTKRELVETFIENIYVFDDKVVVNFFFTNDKRELNINEVMELVKNRKDIARMLDEQKYDIKPEDYDDTFWSLVGGKEHADSF